MKVTGICEAIFYKENKCIINTGQSKYVCLFDDKIKLQNFKKYEFELESVKDNLKIVSFSEVINFKDEYKILAQIIGDTAVDNAFKILKGKFQSKKDILLYLEKVLLSEKKDTLKNITETKDVEKMLERFKRNYRVLSTFKELEIFDINYKDFKHLYRRYKKEQNIYDEIKKDPYDLLYRGNLSFIKCDLIHKFFGGKACSRNRIAKAIWYTLKLELTKGHTYTPKKQLITKVQNFLYEIPFDFEEVILDSSMIVEALNEMSSLEKIIKAEDDSYYLPKVYNFEREISNYFHRRTTYNKPLDTIDNEIKEFEEKKNIKFGSEQKDAIRLSLANDISVITGGAGTGKTSSLACIIYILQKVMLYKDEDICLVAPTGKASRRMSESINGQLQTNFEAKTIHKELKLTPSDDLDMYDDARVNTSEIALTGAKVIIVDETSMLDLHTAYELLTATSDTSKIIFLGDIEQLPPVSYGYFLRDIIEFGVPTTKLLQIHRQSGDSTIVDLSTKIRGETITLSDIRNKPDFGFVSFEGLGFKEKVDMICDLFLRSVKDTSIEDTMVLTPLNDKRGSLSSLELNNAIQDKLMPNKDGEVTQRLNGYTFKIGSKVILTKNLNEKHLVNGQIGYIKSINDNKFTVDFEGEEAILEDNELEHLRLGYVITVHKSQGSEWKNCIYICDSETKMNKKNLVYTAITRAKKKLVVCGMKETFVGSVFLKSGTRRSRIISA